MASRVKRATWGVGVLLVGALLAVAPAAALAGPAPNPEAREATEQGRRSYNLGHWQEAIERFEHAYQMSGDPALLFNLAQAHRQAGHAADAIHFYRSYLREIPNGPSREIAEKQLKELERRGAQAAPPQPAPPAPVPAAPAPAPAAAPASTPPHAPAAAAPAVTPPPVTTAPALASPAPPAPAPSRPLPRLLPWVGAVAAVALAGGAVYEGLASNHRYDELRNSCGQTTAGCTAEQKDDIRSRDRLTTILWVAAGVAAAGTGVMFYASSRETGVSVAARF
jgi:hypothetical protein